MARDYASRCPVSPVRNTWLVAAAILLAAKVPCVLNADNPQHFQPHHPRSGCAACLTVSRLYPLSGCCSVDRETCCKSLLSKLSARSVFGVLARSCAEMSMMMSPLDGSVETKC
ncbi:nectin-2-like protein [Lates japonicus]|uniref:Nectin-2-like protein n=1 Tax=Lates japonicus TaxID=270547 RepID=A0AAD3MQX7_LATJO|nr:nectin-2-like protein [Lates japonicus]